jgi:hypothetical protein
MQPERFPMWRFLDRLVTWNVLGIPDGFTYQTPPNETPVRLEWPKRRLRQVVKISVRRILAPVAPQLEANKSITFGCWLGLHSTALHHKL